MAAAEKQIRVNITGDASGLNNEFSRVQKDAKAAFSDLGLDKVLSNAEKNFTNIQDRIKAISQALRDHKKDTDTEFTNRTKSATTTHEVNRLSEDKQDADQLQSDAWLKWQKLADAWKEDLKNKGANDRLSEAPGGDVSGSGAGGKSTIGNRVAMRAIQGGRFNPGGAVQEAVGGEGGLAEMAGLGLMATSIALAISAALVAVIAKAGQLALADLKVENRLRAKFDSGVNLGKEAYDGISPTELKEFILSQAKSRGTATGIEDISKQRIDLKYAYGLDEGDTQKFDQFRQQGATEGSRLIADILVRSEKGGILGITKNDFTLLPQKIEQIAGIMSIQKSSGEKVDGETALNLISAGTKIGGRFGDDRASAAFGDINQNIRNPGSDGMKAFIFSALRKAHPDASIPDLLAMQENGANKENLQAILPQINAIQDGTFKKYVTHWLAGNWQSGNRLATGQAIPTLLSSLNNKPISDEEAAKRFSGTHDRAENLITGFSDLGAN